MTQCHTALKRQDVNLSSFHSRIWLGQLPGKGVSWEGFLRTWDSMVTELTPSHPSPGLWAQVTTEWVLTPDWMPPSFMPFWR